MKRHLIGPAIALILLGTSATSMYASGAFTDRTPAPEHKLITGTVKLGAAPVSTPLTMTDMLPGDSVTTPLSVRNDGTLPLKYAITSTTSEADLAGQLDMVVKTGVASCTGATFGASGTVLYGPGDFGTPAGQAVLAGRALTPNTSEVLCVQVSLPASVANSYQGRSTTSQLKFVAEQTP